jgi:hypothetical protein
MIGVKDDRKRILGKDQHNSLLHATIAPRLGSPCFYLPSPALKSCARMAIPKETLSNINSVMS